MHSLATSTFAWVGFCVFIFAMLAIDLGLFNRKPHEISNRNAALWSAVWVTLALVFAGLLFGPLGWDYLAKPVTRRRSSFSPVT
jgi:tellurite resistance protein TerC